MHQFANVSERKLMYSIFFSSLIIFGIIYLWREKATFEFHFVAAKSAAARAFESSQSFNIINEFRKGNKLGIERYF